MAAHIAGKTGSAAAKPGPADLCAARNIQRTTEEIFKNPIHPYTKSLLSAIPHPNPRVEKGRTSLHYDYKTSGIDYLRGTLHLLEGTHRVLATEEELQKWC